jgi:hypothetical protein
MGFSMKRTAFVLASIAGLVFSAVGIASANAASATLNQQDDFKIKRAIVDCLFYVSVKDPQGYADLASPKLLRTRDSIRHRGKIELEFNACVASRGIPVVFW